jgi:hypothetical protein
MNFFISVLHVGELTSAKPGNVRLCTFSSFRSQSKLQSAVHPDSKFTQAMEC